MEYPQVFICIDKKTELPSMEVLEGWTDNKKIYMGFGSYTSHPNIEIINEIHKLMHEEEGQHVLAMSSTYVPDLLQISFFDCIEKVYWIDSEEHLDRIKEIVDASDYLAQFRACIYGLEESIDSINGILSNLDEANVSDRQQFHDCLENKIYEVYDRLIPAVKERARIETRMNVLIRLDL